MTGFTKTFNVYSTRGIVAIKGLDESEGEAQSLLLYFGYATKLLHNDVNNHHNLRKVNLPHILDMILVTLTFHFHQ